MKHVCIVDFWKDDSEWRKCLEEAGEMATGRQLRSLFATILRECTPSDPAALWVQFRDKICDDLQHALHQGNIYQNPPEDIIYDYGLYLIDNLLRQANKSLADWPEMPQYQHDWHAALGNRLIRDQRTI